MRANRENNFINVTDLFNAHDRDVRTFNKNSERKNYFVTNPEEHYLSGNDITDEFGMKVTFCHPKLAIVIVDWLYKKNVEGLSIRRSLVKKRLSISRSQVYGDYLKLINDPNVEKYFFTVDKDDSSRQRFKSYQRHYKPV